MRIGMILDKNFPPDPRVENEALSLIEAGHELFLFCLKKKDQQDEERREKIEIRRYATSKWEYKMSALAYTFGFYSKSIGSKIEHFLIQNKIEVMHIHDMVAAEGAMFANRDLKLPVILDLHENRPEIMRFYPHLNKFPGKALISVEKWKRKEEELVQKADRVIVVTDEAAKDLAQRAELDPKKLAVVPNTVKSSFFENYHIDDALIKRYKGKFVLLYLGDTGLRRGLSTVLNSLIHLQKKIVDPHTGKSILKLLVVGSSTSDRILKKEVADLGVEDLVDFEGWQEVDRFPSYILASDVGLCPLHRNQHHDSTFANKIFQYMSFSKPVLVSDCTAQKNLVQNANCGLVHEAENSSDFAKGVVKLFKDKSQAEKFGKNGKTFLEERFVWEKVKNELIELYSSLQEV